MSQEGHNKLPLDSAALHAYNASRVLDDTAVVCHAPLNSSYFMAEGQIVPWCYNCTHLYGKYPDTTVDEHQPTPFNLPRLMLERSGMDSKSKDNL